MTKEQQITILRFIQMRSKIDLFENSALKLMLKSYKAVVKELMIDIDRYVLTLPRDSFTVLRAERMLDEVQLMTKAIQAKLSNDITDMSISVGQYSYQEINKIVSWDNNVEAFNPVSLSASQLDSFINVIPFGGHILNEWVERTFAGVTGEIKEDLLKGFIKGEGYPKIVKRLTEGFGLLESQAITLARTYIQNVNVKAATDIYEANSDIVAKVEWSSIMENGNVKTGRGTCPRCQALDGMQWLTKDKNRPSCPLHARCRCLLIGKTKTWRELGIDVDERERLKKAWVIRKDKTIGKGGVPILDYGLTDQNYAGWWRTRSKTFQNNAIGPRRAELVRSGEIEFSDIVDEKTGRLYRINELIKTKEI